MPKVPPMIGQKKIKANIALGSHGELNVLEDVTPQEAAHIGVLSAMVVLGAVGRLPAPLDYDAYVEIHNLKRHFTGHQQPEEPPNQDNETGQSKIH